MQVSKQEVIVAGAIAGVVSRYAFVHPPPSTLLDCLWVGVADACSIRFCIAPLDVVKIRLQLQTHSLSDPLTHSTIGGSPIYKGILPTFRTIIQQEGFYALWKGNVPAELLYLCYGAGQFVTYRELSELLDNNTNLPHAAKSFVAGATAGGVATTITYPLDLLRTRFAAQGKEDRIYASFRTAFSQILRTEGFNGLFQGSSVAVGGILPYMGLFFATYETLRPPLSTLSMPFGSSDAVAGILAGLVAKTGVFPLDLIRKRLQVQGPTRQRYVHRNIPIYKGVMRSLKDVVRMEGKKGLYKGLGVSLLKAAPASAMTMWTYERVLEGFRVLHKTN